MLTARQGRERRKSPEQQADVLAGATEHVRMSSSFMRPITGVMADIPLAFMTGIGTRSLVALAGAMVWLR